MASDWATPIDIYCERLSPAFWAEPINALTNAAFLLAAFVVYLRWRRAPAGDIPVLVLILILAAIGIGSFLFHTFADRWSVLADVIPITIFIYVYFFFAMRRFFSFGSVTASVITVIFLGLSVVIDRALPAGFLNGSGSYLPALVAIVIVGAAIVRRRPEIGRPVLAAGAIFAISLTFRSIDMAVCGAIPLGTHFLWHILNALTLYVLLLAMMRAAPRAAAG